MESTKIQSSTVQPSGTADVPLPSGEIKGIDFAQAMKIVNNNKKLYLRLLEKFSNNDMSTPFFDNINKKDVAAAESAAHAIKGVSANLGLTDLNNVFTVMDSLLKAGEMPSEAKITEARQAYDEALAAIKTLMGNPEILERQAK